MDGWNGWEPTVGVEPTNLFGTKEVLFHLSYAGVSLAARNRTWSPTFAESCDVRFTTARWRG
jgi:hypothetical protein